MNYQRDILIDENSLDVEWLEQANLAIKYGQYWSECTEEFTRAEENIKIIRSELRILANKDPDKYLGEGVKPTDGNIEAFFRTNKRHKEAKEEWILAMKKMNNAEIVKKEISFTRKSALENLVQLHGQNYFAGPSMPRNLHDEYEKRKEKRKENNTRVRINKS
jgi:hypothetical protein